MRKWKALSMANFPRGISAGESRGTTPLPWRYCLDLPPSTNIIPFQLRGLYGSVGSGVGVGASPLKSWLTIERRGGRGGGVGVGMGARSGPDNWRCACPFSKVMVTEETEPSGFRIVSHKA